jgi:hypothetical protein
MRWNLRSRARELSGCDLIMISIPKSGRTWVRVFVCTYFCKRKLEAAGGFDEKIVQSRNSLEDQAFAA